MDHLLQSWQDAQKHERQILARLNADPALMLAAAVNPLLALKEIGYSVHEDVQQEFEDRLRFGSHKYSHLAALRRHIFEIAGQTFDLRSHESVHTVLLDLLADRATPAIDMADTEPLLATLATGSVQDPLERVAGLHPIMEPLLEYRRLDAGTPRFATPGVYDDIRQGRHTLPITKITVHVGESTR